MLPSVQSERFVKRSRPVQGNRGATKGSSLSGPQTKPKLALSN